MRATYPRKGLDWAGTRALAAEMQPLLTAATAMEWFPNNVACNSPEIASNIEFTSLELQRLWAVPFIVLLFISLMSPGSIVCFIK